MTTSYSSNLKLILMGTGDESGTWGDLTNTNLGTLLEQSIVGYTTQSISDDPATPTTLTMPNGTSATARNYVLELTGVLTANRNMIVPAIEKPYIIYNNTTDGFSVTVKVSGQTGVTVANGKKAIVYVNGTDVIEVANAPVTEAGTQTLTNKTLTSPTINGGTITGLSGSFTSATVYSATSAAATVQGDASTNIIAQRSSSDAVQANLVVRKTRGTVASPTAVSSGDVAGNVSYQVYGGTNYRSVADIVAVVKTYTSDSNISGYLSFLTNGGSTSGTERMRILSSGEVVVGNGETSATPSAGKIQATDGSGTDIAGASVTIQGGRGTGTGAGGSVIIATAPAGTTGTSQNAAVERFRAGPSGQFGIGGANYGTSGQVMTSGGAGAAPTWSTFLPSTPDVQTFTTTGSSTWTKPTGNYSSYKIQIWGAGGSGARGRSNGPGGGGGGGAYLELTGPLSSLSATETAVVGAGGASRTVNSTDGAAGGSSSFTIGATTYTVYGGGGGGFDTSNGGGGGGGSVFAVGGSSTGTSGGAAGGPDAGAGGAAGTTANGESGGAGITGGGGGGGSCDDGTRTNGAGGGSIFGGGGGGAAAEDSNPGPGAGGASTFGGAGGAGAYDSNNATAGAVPGGGGGGSETGNSGAGGNGKVIVTVW